ncbi:MAG: hypothetical protein L0Y44_04830 [Phycisphaerales bacterium]|nr:hypothetical protein [Phycisphaerales bacterium]MCI0629961.1 hypothetical protein [Phycisphaerales bacterium]MCI0675326.1 hypothetical protein [Phycisphaerales bacterium]
MKTGTTLGIPLAVAVIASSTGSADVVEFTNRAEWVAAIGGFDQMQTISFLEYPAGTFLNDQYSNLGVFFADGNDYITQAESFLLDGAGATSNIGAITLEFAEPRASIGVHFPGHLVVELYSDGALIYVSSKFGATGAGFFGGLISSEPFDRAELIDPIGGVNVDTLHFGLPIPSPAGLGVLSIAGLLVRRSRRRP